LLINSLNINNLRNISGADIDADSCLNFLVGDNGAGKTTVIESLMILAKGRSFRTGQVASLIGPHADQFLISARISEHTTRTLSLGLERSAGHWRARKDGQEVKQLSELSESLPLVLLEPNSHLLVSGPPDGRRRYLDWGVFHVEHGFLSTWRRYSRAIRQRNAALRGGDAAMVKSLDPLVADLGEQIHQLRQQQLTVLKEKLPPLLTGLSPQLGEITMRYQNGWSGDGLRNALEQAMSRDLDRGMTGPGPHRADLTFRSGAHAARDSLSRGEMKILATALMLAQAESIAATGITPVLLLDDLASEFDGRHQSNVVRTGLNSGAQIWVTGTTLDERVISEAASARVFHVEHGAVTVA